VGRAQTFSIGDLMPEPPFDSPGWLDWHKSRSRH
jgi:hypothetical protein